MGVVTASPRHTQELWFDRGRVTALVHLGDELMQEQGRAQKSEQSERVYVNVYVYGMQSYKRHMVRMVWIQAAHGADGMDTTWRHRQDHATGMGALPSVRTTRPARQ